MGDDSIRVTATVDVRVDEDELELTTDGSGTTTAGLSAPGVEGVLKVDADTVATAVEEAIGDAMDEADAPTVDRAVESVDLAESADASEETDESDVGEPSLPVDPLAGERPTAEDAKARFQLFRDRAGDWRWRLRHDNGNIIADSGQGYSSKRKAEQGLRSVKANAPGGEVELVPE